MPLSTFLNGGTITQLRGLPWLSLTDTGHVGAGTIVGDTGGGGTTSWVYSGTIPCRIDPMGGLGNPTTGGRIDERSTHLVTAPPGTDIATRNRFSIDNRGTYEVTAVQDRTGELLRFFEVVQVL